MIQLSHTIIYYQRQFLNNYSLQIGSIFFFWYFAIFLWTGCSLFGFRTFTIISILLNIFGSLVSFENVMKNMNNLPRKGHMDMELQSIPFIIPFNYSFPPTSLFYLQSLTCTLEKSSWYPASSASHLLTTPIPTPFSQSSDFLQFNIYTPLHVALHPNSPHQRRALASDLPRKNPSSPS